MYNNPQFQPSAAPQQGYAPQGNPQPAQYYPPQNAPAPQGYPPQGQPAYPPQNGYQQPPQGYAPPQQAPQQPQRKQSPTFFSLRGQIVQEDPLETYGNNGMKLKMVLGVQPEDFHGNPKGGVQYYNLIMLGQKCNRYVGTCMQKWVKVTGNITNDPNYGIQFQVSKMELI